jgi:hypothetical protein
MLPGVRHRGLGGAVGALFSGILHHITNPGSTTPLALAPLCIFGSVHAWEAQSSQASAP